MGDNHSYDADKNSTITVAVAGNPNSGKSTLINTIAGTRLQVGNWPGVTVEKKEAVFKHNNTTVRLVDLPGTYSLSPYSLEEKIVRDYLIEEKPDVIIDVVDATNLERNLYLTLLLLELEIPVVVALNIYDEAEKKGYSFDTKTMEKLLGAKIVPTIAVKKKGIKELLDAVVNISRKSPSATKINYGDDIEKAAEEIKERLEKDYSHIKERYPLRWFAYKVMEGDMELLNEAGISNVQNLIKDALKHLRKAHGEDIESLMAEARYAAASGVTKEVLKRKTFASRREFTELVDKIVLNRILGIPVFLIAMWFVFKLTFDLSTPYVGWIDQTFSGAISKWVSSLFYLIKSPAWMTSLVVHGIIGGVGFVLTFVPVIFAMMFFLTFLEGSGYMARAAFVMDKVMHSIGLHGKSFIPMILGFGCNVPAIYATRTLENRRDRILTALLIPLMSCSARLPVYALFVGVFFYRHSGIVIFSIYLLGIFLAILVGIIFKNTLFKGTSPVFIMELPPYRLPTFNYLMVHTWEKGKDFLIKAGTYILAVSVIVWFALNIPFGEKDKSRTVLGRMGSAVAPVLEPLGFGTWEAGASLITGFVAKEVVVSTMGEIYSAVGEGEEKKERMNISEDLKNIVLGFLRATKDSFLNTFTTYKITSLSAEETGGKSLMARVKTAFTPLSAYAFMVFVLIYMPCLATAITLVKELGSWRWLGVAFLYETALAWIAAFMVYQGGKLLGIE